MIQVIAAQQLKEKPQDEGALKFGELYTDYMLTCEYQRDSGWGEMVVQPFAPIALSPAAMVFHYGQTIFEGLKAYYGEKGEPRLFRARDNFERLNRSGERVCIPPIDVDRAMEGLTQLLQLEREWIPQSPGTSLYIRPFIVATEAHVGVHASKSYLFCIILSPVGAYYPEGLAPVGIYVEDEFVRSVKGGTGFAKTGGNYAASLIAGERAEKRGLSQVLWLDGVHRKYVEEVGAMNIMFKINGEIITPALEGSILPGITRDSILKLAAKLGLPVKERRISVDELLQAAQSGELEECFGTGTAAVVSPVGRLVWKDRELIIGDGGIGPVTQKLYDTLTGIQTGHVADPFGWSTVVQ